MSSAALSISDDGPEVLDSLLEQVAAASGDRPHPQPRDLVRTFVHLVLAEEQPLKTKDEVLALIWQRIGALDEIVSRQLDEILRQPAFQQLEATWRGVDFLVRRSGDMKGVKIRVLHAAKHEVSNANYNTLHRKIVDEALGTFGGEPFSVLVADYSFGPDWPDVSALETLASIGLRAMLLCLPLLPRI